MLPLFLELCHCSLKVVNMFLFKLDFPINFTQDLHRTLQWSILFQHRGIRLNLSQFFQLHLCLQQGNLDLYVTMLKFHQLQNHKLNKLLLFNCVRLSIFCKLLCYSSHYFYPICKLLVYSAWALYIEFFTKLTKGNCSYVA